ncbi:MAG: glycosyltransferase [Bacteroidota bacterium]
MNNTSYNTKNTGLILFERQNISNIFSNHYTPVKKVVPVQEKKTIPEVLFITSYPPRECGIATYTSDLINTIQEKFCQSFSLKVCALEAENEIYDYNNDVKYVIESTNKEAYSELADKINNDALIEVVLIEHEFGLFIEREQEFNTFLAELRKPIIVAFHTVLPHPSEDLKAKVKYIVNNCREVIVMTNQSARILANDYEIAAHKIAVIPHGTHLVPHLDKNELKEKYDLSGRKILSTFGLLSEGKSIETTLDALPEIIKTDDSVLFLVIGKTHPTVKKEQGEKYRDLLLDKVNSLGLQNNVLFINKYLPLPELLEYLQLTDIYVFSSKDRNQAVSGTFSYAVSCGCPIISTPIPHAREVLNDDSGIIVDFENSAQLGEAVTRLLNNNELSADMRSNGLHKIASSAWENTAVAHALLFYKTIGQITPLQYNLPAINLNHIKQLTTEVGMIQFSKMNRPDIDSGYTLDDNARALIAICMHYELTGDEADLKLIATYYDFIAYCLDNDGYFLNYVDKHKNFTSQNYSTNLADSNGRAIWALGYLIAQPNLPVALTEQAIELMSAALLKVNKMYSTRAMAFTIKGLYYYNKKYPNTESVVLIKTLANRLVQMYKHESSNGWEWFESYLTYANSALPEAMLMAGLATENTLYRDIAFESMDFLLSNTFNENGIKVISNKSWMHKGKESAHFGEQPIDVAYTILALNLFYETTKKPGYLTKMELAFNWFLGQNHLNQIVYNPCTGGCYDGLEELHINLNQGAESTISYLLSRLTVEPHLTRQPNMQKAKRGFSN